MVILRSQNKITDFLMISAWASPLQRLISRSFYNHVIFYIIYAGIGIFILIKLCCSAGATTCQQTRYIKVPVASSYYHMQL